MLQHTQQKGARSVGRAVGAEGSSAGPVSDAARGAGESGAIGGGGGVARTGGGCLYTTHSAEDSLGLKASFADSETSKKLRRVVAERLGIAERAVVDALAEQNVEGWQVEKIMGLVEAAMAATLRAVPAPSVRVADDLVVTRLHGPKRLLADRVSTGREVVCCVQSSTNFKPGMRLAQAQEGDGGLWFYTGRLPRGKGRW